MSIKGLNLAKKQAQQHSDHSLQLQPLTRSLVNPLLVYNGYYTVGNSVHLSKLSAVLEGTARNIHPKWHFNDKIFASVPWTLEPEEDLRTLYFRRAKYLREKYDYVVLLFSGGIDCTNALESFLLQGIYPDEILTTWPVKAAEEYYGSYNDRRPENCMSEWLYTIKPALNLLETHHTKIKITVLDSTPDVVADSYTEQDFFLFDHFHSLPGMNRWAPVLKYLRLVSDAHPSHAIITGLEKPFIRRQDDKFYLRFLDVNTYLRSHDNLNVEYFYWSGEATDILRKQAHVLLKFFRQQPELQHHIDERNDYHLYLINTCVYPSYNPNTFQARKQPSLIYNEQQAWVWRLSQYQSGQYPDRWLSYWRNFLLAIDPKYIRYKNHLFDGFVGFLGPEFFIGRL